MTKVIQGVQVLTYSEWQKLPEVAEMLRQTGECDTCDGSGEHECECGDSHTCGACNGTGKETDFREIYEATLRKEIINLEAWRLGQSIKKPSCWLTEKERKAISPWRSGVVVLSISGKQK